MSKRSPNPPPKRPRRVAGGRARGGKCGSEPRLRVRRREQEVVRLATEGQSQHAIARTVGISQPAVCQILRRVDERWQRENQDRVARAKAEQTRKLDYLYREALHAWDQSKAQRTRRRQRKTDGPDAGRGGAIAELIVEDSHGDPRYLEAARRVLADLARVWGELKGETERTGPGLPAVFTLTLGDERTAPRLLEGGPDRS